MRTGIRCAAVASALWVAFACGRTERDDEQGTGGTGVAAGVGGRVASGGKAAVSGGGSGGKVAMGGNDAAGGEWVIGGAGAGGAGGVSGAGGDATGPNAAGGKLGFGGKSGAESGGFGSGGFGVGGEGGQTSQPPLVGAACVFDDMLPSRAFWGLDFDWDEDGMGGGLDNCPVVKNRAQLDGDRDGVGDHCDLCEGGVDSDADGVCDAVDVCPALWDPGQLNFDGQPPGDACDPSRACLGFRDSAYDERALRRALGTASLAQRLINERWRLLSVSSACITATTTTRYAFRILIYAPGNPELTVTYQDGAPATFVERMSGAQGPQSSAEEDREAIALAAQSLLVAETVAGNGFSASVFFHVDDGKFASCSLGRCVDVLYSKGGNILYAASVDLRECRFLGFGPFS